MKYKLGLKRSPYDCRNFKYEKLVSAVELPEELDLRNTMLSVKDQGSQGSCSSMAASQMKEWQENNDDKLYQQLSAQYVYNLRANFPEEGMNPLNTMKILCNYGIVEEKLYPYYTNKDTGEISIDLLERGQMYRCAGYAKIYTIEGLKQALYENGACYIAVPVYNFGLRMWLKGDTFYGGHAMTVVGYNKEGFIIRNSWGEKWGDKGHCIFPYEDWGMHWETWTTIDEDTIPEPKPRFIDILKKIWNFFVRLFNRIFRHDMV